MTDILKKIKESDKSLFVGLAGPGAGKTHTFKKIIESGDYKGKNILILTFINKLVDDLTEEFKNFKNVKVSTLHSFAKKELEKIANSNIGLDPYLDDVISEDYFLIKGNNVDYKKKFYDGNLSKEEGQFYKERQNFYKYESDLYSFNSVVCIVNRIFEAREFKIPKYDLILIDEFQDFNKSECELIKLLNKKNKVVLVGDDNQSLYNFKNARPEQIRKLYSDIDSESFSLDYCYRCTEVVVNAANDLVKKAKIKGYLKDSLEKVFLYPTGRNDKDEMSKKFPKIDFMPALQGNKLIYKLSEDIKKYAGSESRKRILIIVPSYLKQTIYDGLMEKGFHVVGFELFSDEECNKKKHSQLIDIFEILAKRKTDDFSLRKILFLYLDEKGIKDALQKNKKIWLCLGDDIKKKIEKDIEIFKKAKKGKEKLDDEELNRFDKIFSIKNILSRLLKGFKPIKKGSWEIEMTTVISSKGLSVDGVYYVGIDDRIMIDEKIRDFTDQKICEFLVGITRSKERLVLISLWDKSPKILEFLEEWYINKIES